MTQAHPRSPGTSALRAAAALSIDDEYRCWLRAATQFARGPSAEIPRRARKESYQKGEINDAIIELKNALQKDPNTAPKPDYCLGRIYLSAGDGVNAEKELCTRLGSRTCRTRTFNSSLQKHVCGKATSKVSWKASLRNRQPDSPITQDLLVPPAARRCSGSVGRSRRLRFLKTYLANTTAPQGLCGHGPCHVHQWRA